MPVVEIGDQEAYFPAIDGEVIAHEFIHSMYDVSVVERFKVLGGSLNLFHVDSASDAALEYYMIERRGEGNVSRSISEFCIPEKSNGKHVLRIKNQSISLGDTQAGNRSVCIRLTRLPVIIYWVALFLK